MTILVGVLCHDGVVIGADSAMTFSAGQIRTIEQPAKKVHILCEQRMILAGTGEVGMGQRFSEVIEDAYKKGVFRSGNTPVQVGTALSSFAVQNFASTNAPNGSFGALLAFPLADKPQLCEFAVSNFQPELKTADIWYVSMGSGQLIVDPFLALIRRVFWNDGVPGCQDAAFAVHWAISHAIEINPGGVNKPVSIGVLRRTDGKFAAALLSDKELAAHAENVSGVEKYLRKYKDILQGSAGVSVPALPAVPE
jgi:hypothetical protein